MGFKEQTKNQLYASGFAVFDGFCDRQIAVAKKQLFAFIYSGEAQGGLTLCDLAKEGFRFEKRYVVIEAYSDGCSVLPLDEAIDGFLRNLSYTDKFYVTDVRVSAPSEDKVHSRYKRRLTITANELIDEGKVGA